MPLSVFLVRSLGTIAGGGCHNKSDIIFSPHTHEMSNGWEVAVIEEEKKGILVFVDRIYLLLRSG